MTLDETKTAILTYINSTDPVKALKATNIMWNALLNNAGIPNPNPIETNFSNILAAMQSQIGTP